MFDWTAPDLEVPRKMRLEMQTLEHPRRYFSADMRTAAATALNYGKKALACSLAYLMIPLGVGDLYAQSAPPPPPPDQGQYQDQAPPPPDQQYGDQDQGRPPQAYNALSPDQIDQMVAPIALYPDPLLAQVLPAATFVDQVDEAARWMRAYNNTNAIDDQPWDVAGSRGEVQNSRFLVWLKPAPQKMSHQSMAAEPAINRA